MTKRTAKEVNFSKLETGLHKEWEKKHDKEEDDIDLVDVNRPKDQSPPAWEAQLLEQHTAPETNDPTARPVSMPMQRVSNRTGRVKRPNSGIFKR